MKIINKKTNEILEGKVRELAKILNVHIATVYRWRNRENKNIEWTLYKEEKKDINIFWQCNNIDCDFDAFIPPIYNKCPKCSYRRELSKKKIAELIKKYYGN
jgi:hypothetical protein